MSTPHAVSSPADLSLPTTMMDFLDPGALGTLLSPDILEGNDPPLHRPSRSGSGMDSGYYPVESASKGKLGDDGMMENDHVGLMMMNDLDGNVGLDGYRKDEGVDEEGHVSQTTINHDHSLHPDHQHHHQHHQEHHPTKQPDQNADFFDFDLSSFSPLPPHMYLSTQPDPTSPKFEQDQNAGSSSDTLQDDAGLKEWGMSIVTGNQRESEQGVEMEENVGGDLQRQLERISMQSPALFAVMARQQREQREQFGRPEQSSSQVSRQDQQQQQQQQQQSQSQSSSQQGQQSFIPSYLPSEFLSHDHYHDHSSSSHSGTTDHNAGGASAGAGAGLTGQANDSALNGQYGQANGKDEFAWGVTVPPPNTRFEGVGSGLDGGQVHQSLPQQQQQHSNTHGRTQGQNQNPLHVSPPMNNVSQDSSEGTFAINRKGEIVFTPLLSPAMGSPSTVGSGSRGSPNFVTGSYGSNPSQQGLAQQIQQQQQQKNGKDVLGMDQQAQLHVLQQQQLAIQKQLDMIQRQQAQAQQQQVAGSPFLSPMINPQGTTGTFTAPYQGSSRGTSTSHPTPKSEFFSPLTSPALNPVQMGFRSGSQQGSQSMHQGGQGHVMNNEHMRHRSLSGAVAPSPVVQGGMMNNSRFPPPTRSGSGMEQTMSPALLPQPDAWRQTQPMTSQAYLDELAKMINGNGQEQGLGMSMDYTNGEYGLAQDQAVQKRKNSTVGKSPALRPSRSSAARSRPSPMMKPTQRPGRGGANTVPPSPLITAYTPMVAPASARMATFDNEHFQSESLSPVDLSQMIMPPPPAPLQAGRSSKHPGQGRVAPITPATLMQIGPPSQTALGTRVIAHKKGGMSETNSSGSGRSNMADVHEEDVGDSLEGTPRSGKRSLEDVAEEPGQSFDKIAAGWSASLQALRPNDSTKAKIIRAAKTGKSTNDSNIPPEGKKTSHKAAEQRRRDSLKAGFDELRLLLPPINTEALDPETGEPIPGSSAPRLLPKSSLVPDDNPNKGVSKVALLKYSNEYIERMQSKVERRNNYIDLLKEAVQAVRVQAGIGSNVNLDELLGYAFEDEDEEEEPTGANTHRLKPKPLMEDPEGEEMEEDTHMEQTSSRSTRPQAKPTRRKSTTTTTRPQRAAVTRQKSSILRSGESSLSGSPLIYASHKNTEEVHGLDIDMI